MKKSLLLDFFIADINMHFINVNTKIFKEFVKLYSEKFIYLIFTILTLISPPFGRGTRTSSFKLLPINALAIGDSFEILPLNASASQNQRFGNFLLHLQVTQ